MLKTKETKWQVLRKFLDEYLKEDTSYRAGEIYQAYFEKDGSMDISRKDFEMFLRDQVMKEHGLLKRVSHGVYEMRTDPNDRGVFFSRGEKAEAQTREISLDEILDDSIELTSKISAVLKYLKEQDDVSFSAKMELKRISAYLIQSMDTAITGITSAMAWCEDNLDLDVEEDTEAIQTMQM